MSDRHEKWTPVEPGTVIPAGQPWRVEHEDGSAYEHPGAHEPYVHHDYSETMTDLLVDSSWKPPLELPTEPTWGIVVHRKHGIAINRWHLVTDELMNSGGGSFREHNVLDFIPLTPEQVARIEAAQ